MSSSSNNNGIRRNPARSASSSSSSSHSPAKSSSATASNGHASSSLRSTRAKNTPSYNDSEENSNDDIKQISSSTNSKLNLNGTNGQKSSSFASSSGTTSSKANAASASASAGKLDMETVAKFESITGLSRAEAIEFLEASNNKLEKAVNLWFQEQNSSKPSTNTKFGTKRNYSRLNNMDETSNSNEPFVSVVDDNTNDSSSVDVDDVRAPIPQKVEKLLNYDPYALALAPQSKRMRVNAFDGYRPNEDGQPAYAGNSSSKSKTLGALFRPPVDLLFNGTFEASKIQGCKVNKWVLLNVQNQNEFYCQILNRDVWSDDTVKEIVKENFVFIQIYFDSLDGKKLINYYNISSYPFLAIIDPRTGEKLMQFTSSKIDQLTFCEKVTTFLADYENPIKESELEHYQNGDSKKSNEVIKVDDEDDIVELKHSNMNKNDSKSNASLFNNHLNKLTNGSSSKNSNSFDKSKPKKANDIISSVIVDEKSEDYVEVEDSDVLSTDGSSDSSQEALNKKKVNGQSSGTKRLESSEDADVNIENSDDDETVVSKEKYDREKLIKKQQQLNGIKNSTNDSKLSPDENNSKSLSSKNLMTSTTTQNSQPSQTRYETPDSEKKDCILRILYPNGDRLDFCTNGNSKIKVLLDYLTKQGFKKNAHELIERLMPNMKTTNDTEVTNQSRNLFNSDHNLTFKELSLYPRVFLLLQES